jgi:hypothetical protein
MAKLIKSVTPGAEEGHGFQSVAATNVERAFTEGEAVGCFCIFLGDVATGRRG